MGKSSLSSKGKENLNNYISRVYESVGEEVGEEFAVEPSIVQRLYEKQVESGSWFLGMINVQLVASIKGEKIGLSVPGLVTSRTEITDTSERTPKSIRGEDKRGYECQFTESDIYLPYSLIDTWRHHGPEKYAEIYASAYRKALTNDRVRIGLHGISIAKTTDREANPNGEDVNKGWLQKLREEAPEQIDEDALTFGHASANFRNLDMLVEAVKQMIPSHFREDSELVVLMSSDLMGSQNLKNYESNGDEATNKVLMNDNRVTGIFAGLPAYIPPFMPDGVIIVTYVKNLSIYLQEDTARRHIENNPKKNRVEDYNSENVDYVIEETEAIAAVTNVSLYVEPEPEA